MYKVLENRPKWFDQALENKIEVTWDNFTGVNGVNTKKRAIFEIILAIYRFYLGDKVDDFYLDRSEELNMKKISKGVNIENQYEATEWEE